MVTNCIFNFKLLANFNDVDFALAMYGRDDEDTLRQWKDFNPWKTSVCSKMAKWMASHSQKQGCIFECCDHFQAFKLQVFSVWLSYECLK